MLTPTLILMAVSQPSVFTGINFGQITKIFKKKCRVYVSLGEMATGDVPTTSAELTTLIDDAGSEKFLPFGNMDEDIGSIKYTQEKDEIDFHTIPGDFDITATLKSVILEATLLSWFDDDEAKGQLSFLFIPDGSTTEFVALSGVVMTIDGTVDLGGKKSVAGVELTRSGALTDIIKYATGLS